MRSAKMMLACLTLTGLMACGYDPLSEAEAKKAWPATKGMSDGAGSNSLSMATPLTISIGTPCPRGGKMGVGLDTDDFLQVGETQVTSVQFALLLQFEECETEEGVTIDGDLKYALGMATDGNTSSFTWGWKGELAYDGSGIEGDCRYDIRGEYIATAGTPTSPAGLTLNYSGSMCGHDSSVLLNLQAQ